MSKPPSDYNIPYETLIPVGWFAAYVGCVAGVWAFFRALKHKEKIDIKELAGDVGICAMTSGSLVILLFILTHDALFSAVIGAMIGGTGEKGYILAVACVRQVISVMFRLPLEEEGKDKR